MTQELPLFPDRWSGWKRKENGEIDYSLDDKDYLEKRRKFLMYEVFGIRNDPDNFYEYIIPEDNDIEKLIDTVLSESHSKVVLNWGCGSGKTNKLKWFCSQSSDPVLVVVKSNEEIDRLVFDVKALNPKQSIVAYHSETETIEESENDLDYLSNFRILVTNYVRINTDPIFIMLNYNPKNCSTIDYLLGMKSSIRKYVLIDELPTLYSGVSIDFNRFVTKFITKSVGFDIKTQKRYNYSNLPEKLNNKPLEFIMQYPRFREFLDWAIESRLYLEFLSNKQIKIKNPRHEKLLQERFSRSIIQVLQDFYQPNSSDVLWFYRSIQDIPAFSKIFILDATAEFIFEGSSKWKVIRDYDTKFKVNEILNPIPFSYLRKGSTLKGEDLVNKFNREIQNVLDVIKSRPDNKHLVILWKSSEIDSKYENDPTIVFEDGKFILTNQMKKLGEEQGIHNFEVVHYGGSKVRGTNEFQDYDTCIIIDEYFLPNYTLNKMSNIVSRRVENIDYLLSEVKQFVFRSQARLGKPIDIAFTYDPNNPEKLEELQNRLLISSSVSNEVELFKMNLINEISKSKMRKEVKEDFLKIINNLSQEDFKSTLMDNQKVIISFDILRLLAPKARDRVIAYDPLVRSVKEHFGIDIIITKNR